MSNKDVAAKWRAQIKDRGNSLNMFFEHDVIYSYGYHFPMAQITNKLYKGKAIILQNSDRYSNTTARHLSHMRGECYGDAVIEMSTDLLKKAIRHDADINYIKDDIRKEIQERIDTATLKRDRARKEWSKEMHQRDIDENLGQLEVLQSL